MLRKKHILFSSILTLGLLLFYALKNKKNQPAKNYQITTTTLAPNNSTVYKPEEEAVINPSIETVVPQPKERKITPKSKLKQNKATELEQNKIIDANHDRKVLLLSHNYDQYLNQNYYLTKCQNDEASNKAIELVTLQIIKNQNKNTYYLNFEVKTKPSVELNLIFKNKKINVSQTTNNSFVFSLQKNNFTDQESLATLELSSQNITSVLELRFDSVKQLATLNPIEQSILSKNLCLKNYIWFGLGFSYFNHDQTLQDNQIKVKYQSQLQNGLLFGFRKTLTQNFGIYGSMIKNSGKVDKAQILNVTADGLNQMSWSHYELGTEYMINMPKLIYTYLLIPYFSLGLVKYETQRVAIDNNDNATFRNLDSYHASLGLGFKTYSLNNYFFDTRLSYKPLLSSPNHSTSSNLIYSVSLGLAKAFNKFSLGFFWEGHQISTKYKESSGPDINEGQLNNLYSDLSLQAGFFF